MARARGAIRRDGVPLGNVVSGTFTYANGLGKVEIIRSDGRIAGADPAMLAVTGQIGVRFADTTLLDLAVGGTTRIAVAGRHRGRRGQRPKAATRAVRRT
jgi:hypothetical protein